MAFKEELKDYECSKNQNMNIETKKNILKTRSRMHVPQQVLLVLHLFRKGNLGNVL